MIDDNGTPEDAHHGEHTGKVQQIVHAELEPINGRLEHGERLAKRLWWFGGAAVTIFLAGVATILFLSSRFAAAQDVERIMQAQTTAAQEFNRHVVTEAAKMGALEAQSGNIENDYHSIREQLWRVADRVGASRVAVPMHEPVITVQPMPRDAHP